MLGVLIVSVTGVDFAGISPKYFVFTGLNVKSDGVDYGESRAK